MKLSRIGWTSFALAALAVAGGTLVAEWDYYGSGRMYRHHAAEHDLLSPGGSYGHVLGIVGSAMMVLNLLYLVRRRWARIEGVGDLSSWLAFHVALGVGGVALVFAHSALLFDNLVAKIAMVAAGIVLLTGVVGRWIYAQVPHRPDGHEAGEAELVAALRARMTSVRPELRTAVEDAEHALTRIAAPPVPSPLVAALQAAAMPLVLLRYAGARASWARRLQAAPYALAAADAGQVLAVATEATLLRRRFRRQAAFKNLVGSWRGVHRAATFILLLALAAHVVTVLYFAAR